MTREMFSELLQRNKELEEQFVRATDSAMQLLEIDKEHQRINGELREENKKLKNIIEEIEEYIKNRMRLQPNTIDLYTLDKMTLIKLQELKDSDKE